MTGAVLKRTLEFRKGHREITGRRRRSLPHTSGPRNAGETKVTFCLSTSSVVLCFSSLSKQTQEVSWRCADKNVPGLGKDFRVGVGMGGGGSAPSPSPRFSSPPCSSSSPLCEQGKHVHGKPHVQSAKKTRPELTRLRSSAL